MGDNAAAIAAENRKKSRQQYLQSLQAQKATGASSSAGPPINAETIADSIAQQSKLVQPTAFQQMTAAPTGPSAASGAANKVMTAAERREQQLAEKRKAFFDGNKNGGVAAQNDSAFSLPASIPQLGPPSLFAPASFGDDPTMSAMPAVNVAPKAAKERPPRPSQQPQQPSSSDPPRLSDWSKLGFMSEYAYAKHLGMLDDKPKPQPTQPGQPVSSAAPPVQDIPNIDFSKLQFGSLASGGVGVGAIGGPSLGALPSSSAYSAPAQPTPSLGLGIGGGMQPNTQLYDSLQPLGVPVQQPKQGLGLPLGFGAPSEYNNGSYNNQQQAQAAVDSKKAQQQEYARDLQAQMQNKQQQGNDRGGQNEGLGLQIGTVPDKEAKRRQQQDYARELQQQVSVPNVGANKQQSIPSHSDPYNLNPVVSEKEAKRRQQQEYASALVQQMEQKVNNPGRGQPEEQGFAIGGQQTKEEKRRQQQEYANALQSQQMQGKGGIGSMGGVPNGGFGGDPYGQQGNANLNPALSEKEAKRRQQQEYASALVQQMDQKNQGPSQNGVGLGRPTEDLGFAIGGQQSKEDKRRQQQEYANALQAQQMQGKGGIGSGIGSMGGGIVGGAVSDSYGQNNGLNPAMAEKEAKRRQQQDYANALQLDQMGQKNNNQTRNQPEDQGFAIGGQQSKDEKKRQQQEYANALNQQVDQRLALNTHSDGGQVFAIGADNQSKDEKRRRQEQYTKDLQAQQAAKQMHRDRDGLGGSGGLGQIGGAQLDKDQKRQKQMQYAQELQAQQMIGQPQVNGPSSFAFGRGLNSDPQAQAQQLQSQGLGLQIGGDLPDKEKKRRQQQEYAAALAQQVVKQQPQGMGLGGMQAQPVYGQQPDAYPYGNAVTDYSAYNPAVPPMQQFAAPQTQNFRHGRGQQPAAVGGGGGLGLQIGDDADHAKAARLKQQQDYAMALKQQMDAKGGGLSGVSAAVVKAHQHIQQAPQQSQGVTGAVPGADGHLPPGWVMGPLGVPVRKTLDVGNRGVQKAFNNLVHTSPTKDNASQGHNPFAAAAVPSMGALPMPGFGSPVGMGGPGTGMHMDLFSQAGIPSMGGGYPGAVPQQPMTAMMGVPGAAAVPAVKDLFYDLNAESEEERKRLIRLKQQKELEEQIAANKLRIEQEKQKKEEEERKEQARIEKEQRELKESYEREQQKQKREEDLKRELERQAEAKKQEKLELQRKAAEDDQKENARVEREREQLRRREEEERRREEEERWKKQAQGLPVEMERPQSRAIRPMHAQSQQDQFADAYPQRKPKQSERVSEPDPMPMPVQDRKARLFDPAPSLDPEEEVQSFSFKPQAVQARKERERELQSERDRDRETVPEREKEELFSPPRSSQSRSYRRTKSLANRFNDQSMEDDSSEAPVYLQNRSHTQTPTQSPQKPHTAAGHGTRPPMHQTNWAESLDDSQPLYGRTNAPSHRQPRGVDYSYRLGTRDDEGESEGELGRSLGASALLSESKFVLPDGSLYSNPIGAPAPSRPQSRATTAPIGLPSQPSVKRLPTPVVATPVRASSPPTLQQSVSVPDVRPAAGKQSRPSTQASQSLSVAQSLSQSLPRPGSAYDSSAMLSVLTDAQSSLGSSGPLSSGPPSSTDAFDVDRELRKYQRKWALLQRLNDVQPDDADLQQVFSVGGPRGDAERETDMPRSRPTSATLRQSAGLVLGGSLEKGGLQVALSQSHAQLPTHHSSHHRHVQFDNTEDLYSQFGL